MILIYTLCNKFQRDGFLVSLLTATYAHYPLGGGVLLLEAAAQRRS
jgi:hypothetical protein